MRNCITNRRKWGSKRGPRGRLVSDEKEGRRTLGLGQSADSELHYKSAKPGAGESRVVVWTRIEKGVVRL